MNSNLFPRPRACACAARNATLSHSLHWSLALLLMSIACPLQASSYYDTYTGKYAKYATTPDYASSSGVSYTAYGTGILLPSSTSLNKTTTYTPSVVDTGLGGSASLAGYVYAGTSSYVGVHGAEVDLYNEDDMSTVVAKIYTDIKGYYRFTNITSGTYSLVSLNNSSAGTAITIGTLVENGGDNDGFAGVDIGTANTTKHSITGIILDDGEVATGYNFGNTLYPSELLSKDLLIGSGTLNPTVPEPGTWILTLVGVGLVGLIRYKRRAA